MRIEMNVYASQERWTKRVLKTFLENCFLEIL